MSRMQAWWDYFLKTTTNRKMVKCVNFFILCFQISKYQVMLQTSVLYLAYTVQKENATKENDSKELPAPQQYHHYTKC